MRVSPLVLLWIAMVSVTLMFCISLAYAEIPTKDLISAWNFNEDAGVVANDAVSDNHGTIIGDPNRVEGKYGLALEFDGVDDMVEVPADPSLDTPNAFTAAAWIKVYEYPNHAGVVWKGNMMANGAFYTFRIAVLPGQGITWGACSAGTEGWFASGGTVESDTWTHVCITGDGDTPRGYINGLEDGTRRVLAPYLVYKDEPLRIGESHFGPPVYFKGVIDEVVLYNRGLSPDEVNELMNNPITGVAVEVTGKLAATWATVKEQALNFTKDF